MARNQEFRPYSASSALDNLFPMVGNFSVVCGALLAATRNTSANSMHVTEVTHRHDAVPLPGQETGPIAHSNGGGLRRHRPCCQSSRMASLKSMIR